MAAEPGKTERGTPKRRSEARREGQAPRSMELNSLIVLLVGMLLTLLFAPWMGQRMAALSIHYFNNFGTLQLESAGDVTHLWRVLSGYGALILAPVLLSILAAGTFVAYKQVGWKWNWSAMEFKFDKLNFFQGLKSKFLSMNQVFELGKNLLKVFLLGAVAFFALHGAREQVAQLIYLEPGATWMIVIDLVRNLSLRMLAVLAVLAVLDVKWQSHRYEESIKMSKQEVKQEHKDAEGDPRIKARLRSMMLDILRQRMMHDTKTADVVVTNPTHISIAIKYVQGEPAPRIVAKGKGFLALRIRTIALENRVPVIEDKPLARALYKTSKVGSFIPAKLYESVAKVLAAVYRASSKRAEGRG